MRAHWVPISILCISMLAGCENEQQTKSRPAKQGATTSSSERQDYLSVAFRAKRSAERQLGEVQKERKEQIREEKAFDRPTSAEPTP
ncbi:MAG: hypothetical protein ACR2IE_09495 [Candidatus Sumerlaeaceae bacterium]